MTLSVLAAGLQPCLAASTLQSTRTGTDVPSAHVCASVTPVPSDDFRGAFAYEFESPDVVAFLADLKRVPSSAQHRIFLNAVGAASTLEQQNLETAEAIACPNLDEAYDRIRGLAYISKLWHLREINGADTLGRFAAVLTDTISASSIGDRLTPEQRRLALAPLAEPVRAAEPTPKLVSLNEASAPCKKPDVPPRRLESAYVVGSAAAARAGTHGIVEVRLDVGETGEILSAREVSDDFNNGPGSEEMVRSAIFVAATAVFAPEIKDCKPVRSVYIFRAGFDY